MAATQGDRIKRLQATNPRIVPVAIPAATPISGVAPGTTVGSVATTAANAQVMADYAANRPVGDMTAQVLANSGTNIQSYAATLFTFVNGAFQLSIGAGGLVQSVGGVNKLSLSPAGSWFAGALNTDEYVYARGTVVASIPWLGSVTTSGYFINPHSSGCGVVGQAMAGGNGVGVAGLGISAGVYGAGQNYGVYSDGHAFVNGSMTVTGNLYAGAINAYLPLSYITYGSQANFDFSLDGGSTWAPLLLRKT